MDRGDLAPGRLISRRVPARLLLALVLCLAWTATSRAGHELPFYPSYYPQEITVQTMTPGLAAEGFQKNSLHAYLGPDPYAGKTLPKGVQVVESLGAYVVVTFNPAARRAENRCDRALDLARRFAAAPDAYVPHPYPVTPYHADYLQHYDLAEKSKARWERIPPPLAGGSRLRAQGPLAERLVGGARARDLKNWEAAVEVIELGTLLAPHGTTVNGWAGPSWIKEGWFHAYLLLAPTIADRGARQAADDIARRIMSGGFARPEERLTAERRLVAALRATCERVVVGYTLRREYLNADYSAGVENAARDAHAGLNSAIFVRTVKLKDFPWNGWLTVGVAGKPAAAWNPIGGFTDETGRLVWHAVGDPGLFPEAHNASWTPNRVRLISIEGTATGSLAVPRDALLPQAGTGLLREVGAGKRAKARITYRLLGSAFHDGTRVDVADLLYALSFAFKWGGGNPADRDPHVERATALAREWLAGVKLLRVETDTLRFGEVRMTYQVPVIDVYLAGWTPDPEQLASVAPPWSTVPWPVLALMEEAVTRGAAAFSAEMARRRGVPWLDLVRDEKTKALLASLLDELERQAHIPPSLVARVTPAEARNRWAALRRFADEHGHYLVTNGPYLLHAGSATGAVLRVFRDFSYPMGVGTYNAWAIPLRAYIARAEVRGRRVEVSGEVEWIERFGREHRIVREPLQRPAAHKDKGPLPVARYVVLDAEGSVLRAAAVEPAGAGLFTIELEGEPTSGARTVLLTLAVQGNHVSPQIRIVRVE